MLLWVQPKIKLAFWAASAHCQVIHIQSFIHQYLHILLLRGTLNPFIPQPVLILGVAPTQVQDHALGPVEPQVVLMGPSLKPVRVSLDDIPALGFVSCTTHLGVTCKLADGALNSIVYVTDEGIKQYWS